MRTLKLNASFDPVTKWSNDNPTLNMILLQYKINIIRWNEKLNTEYGIEY